MKNKQPSKLEMAILSLIWNKGTMTAREVLEALPDKKERAYTSVLSVLQAMERKGFVAHSRSGKTNLYRATIKQEDTVGRTLRDLLRDVFGGSPQAALQHLLQDTEVSEAALQEMEEMVAAFRKGKKQS